LDELRELLELCEVEKIGPFASNLFRRLTRCVTGDNFVVADRAMCLFVTDFFKKIFEAYKSISFLIVVPSISRMSERHVNL